MIEAIDRLRLNLLPPLRVSDALLGRTLAVLGSEMPRPQYRPCTIRPALEAQRERLNKLYVPGRISDADYEAQYAALATPVASRRRPRSISTGRWT